MMSSSILGLQETNCNLYFHLINRVIKEEEPSTKKVIIKDTIEKHSKNSKIQPNSSNPKHISVNKYKYQSTFKTQSQAGKYYLDNKKTEE